MIKRYCKGCEQSPIIPIVSDVIASAVDEDGNNVTMIVKEEVDNDRYGSFRDWSLDAMVKAGINPSSFSSPAVVGSRIGVAAAVNSIDLSSLDNE